MPVILTKIAKGQIFVPFHYGYFDKAKGSAAAAANELTFGKTFIAHNDARLRLT